MIGLTYDPVHDEMFTARRGGGAFRNGAPIRVSGNPTASTPRASPSPTASASRARAMSPWSTRRSRHGFEHRRCGSTAIQLCWVADGRCDAFVTLYCSSWDCLAGLILVEEAGGLATDFVADHGLLGKGGVAACTPALAAADRAAERAALRPQLTGAHDRRMVARMTVPAREQ